MEQAVCEVVHKLLVGVVGEVLCEDSSADGSDDCGWGEVGGVYAGVRCGVLVTTVGAVRMLETTAFLGRSGGDYSGGLGGSHHRRGRSRRGHVGSRPCGTGLG